MKEEILNIIKYDASLKQATCPLCHKNLPYNKINYFKCCSFFAHGGALNFHVYIDDKLYIIYQYFNLKKTYIRYKNTYKEITINGIVEFNFEEANKLKEQIETIILFS